MNVQSRPTSAQDVEEIPAPVPTWPYVSPQFFELERGHVFKKSWLMLGRETEIPNVGDYVIKPIELAHAEIILVRDKHGKIGAFHNVCSHRAAKVAWGRSGNTRAFVCPYHAWTYGLDGSLRGVPGDQRKFHGLDKKDCGLTPVTVDTWQGFIFVNLDPNPREGLRAYLGSLADYAEGFPFDRDNVVMRIEFPELRCNWKIALDAFQEAYHLGILHQQTLKGIFTSKERPIGEPIAVDTYDDRHRTVSFWVNTAHQVGPVEALAHRFASNINSTAGNAASNAKERLYQLAPKINPTRDPGWGVDGTIIFPNTQILLMAGSYQVMSFWPLTVDSCRITMAVYYAEPGNAGERFARECGFAHTKGVVLEDIHNCEHTHSAHKARVKKTLNLQDGESAIAHNWHVLEQMLAAYITADMRDY